MPADLAKVKKLFVAVLEMSVAERASYLDTACAGDTALRAEIEAMLRTHENSGELLPRPPGEMLAEANATEAGATAAFASQLREPATFVDAVPTDPESLSFLSPSDKPGCLGQLGHYEVQQIIGKGGFGVVLRAFDEKLHRIVAIKVLSPAYSAIGSARKRFIREARAAAAVSHDHVVGIYAVEETQDPPYIVMQCIDGMSLQDKLDKKGPLSLKEILRIGLQTAEGLAAAHKQGLVHRDIKPANILLENGVERVKITDFGLARAVDDASVTQSGTVAGTPMYMSPEQAEGLPIDHRSDLFSLGTVLYAMCTGHPPFRASGTHAVLKRVIDASPRPIREVNNEIPDWLCAIISKLHAKKAEDRFQTAKEVAELLGQRLADVQAGRAIERAGSVSDGLPSSVAHAPSSPGSAPIGILRPVLMSLAFWVVSVPLVYAYAVLVGPLFGNDIARFFFGTAAIAIVPIVVFEALAGRRRRPIFRALALVFLYIAVGSVLTGFFFLPEFGHVSIGANDPEVRVRLIGEDGVGFNLQPTDEMELPAGVYRVETSCGSGHVIDFISIEEWGNKRTFPGGVSKDAMNVKLEKRQRATILVRVRLKDASEPGWVQLFNGKDLTGWMPSAADKWKVDKNLLIGVARGHLISDQTYQDFHLRVKAKFNADAVGTIAFRGVTEPNGDPIAHGEVSIGNKSAGKTGSAHLWYKGKPADVVNWNHEAIPASAWFDLDLIVRGKEVTVKVNGSTAQVILNRLPERGRISLNAYEPGSVIEFSKIEIKELPPEEPGWVQLFNGKDLTGWKEGRKTDAKWTVEKDVLVGRAGDMNKPPSFLLSERSDYRNFHFRIEAMTDADDDDGGQCFRYLFRAGSWKGYEAQIQHKGPWEKTGSLWWSDTPGKSTGITKVEQVNIRGGEWFTQEVIAKGSRVTVILNGKVMSEISDPAHDIGHLALLLQRGTIRFRKIEIKELPPEEPGWVQLFNGTDIPGTSAGKPDRWQVKDGVLVGTGKDAFLVVAKGLRDFRCRVEAKVVSRGGASVDFRRASGMLGQAVLETRFAHIRAGSLTLYVPPKPGVTLVNWDKPPASPDGWFTVEMLVVGNKATIQVDGVTTAKEHAIPNLPETGDLMLSVHEKGAVVHFKRIDIKELPPSLPKKAAEIPRFVAGTWKIDSMIVEPKLPAAQAKMTGFNVFEPIAGGKFLRGYSNYGDGQFESLMVQHYDKATDSVKGWFFSSKGENHGPGVGRWNADTRTMLWLEKLPSGLHAAYEFEFADVNTIKTRVYYQDDKNQIVFELRGTGTRLPGPVGLKPAPVDAKRPIEMKIIDPFVGDWETEGLMKVKTDQGLENFKFTTKLKSRHTLGGRMIATEETGLPGHEDAYWLLTYDTGLKAYRFWMFNGAGEATTAGGGWDEKAKTMKWLHAEPDGRSFASTWQQINADRWQWTTLMKDALGKTVLDIEATKVRLAKAPGEPGWVQLFNGKDLPGTVEAQPDSWKVLDRALVGSGERGLALLKVANDLKDFHCRIEAKVAGRGLAVVDFRRSDPTRAQAILESKYPERRAGSLALYVAPKPGVTLVPWDKPPTSADGWFTIEIIAVSKKVTIKVNGVTTVKEQVVAELPDRGDLVLSVIDKAAVAHFRKIEIKELPPEEPGWTPLFNGKDLTGWLGWHGTEVWSWKDGTLTGNRLKELSGSITNDTVYKDFELKFKARLKDGQGRATLAFRLGVPPDVRDRGLYLHLGEKYWGTVNAASFGRILPAVADLKRFVKPADFNDITIKCVGRRVIVKINGLTTVDADMPEAGLEGTFAWDVGHNTELTVRDLQFKALPPAQPEPAFQPLFNGKDLDGWFVKLPESDRPLKPGQVWEVSGNLVMAKSVLSGSYLRSDKTYCDYHLKLEFRRPVGAQGTGGVFLFGAKPDKLWPKSLQIELSPGRAKLMPIEIAGEKQDLNIPFVGVGIGEWQRLEVVVRNGTLEIMNGKGPAHVVKGEQGPRHIGLWVNRGEIHFRNVEVKELPATNVTDKRSDTLIKAFSPAVDKPSATLADVVAEKEGWSISSRKGASQLQLSFDTPAPPLAGGVLIFRAKLRCDKGERLAHLGIEYGVRGEPDLRINSQGETNSVPSAAWRDFQARLRIDPKKKPDQIKAKVVINGVANAWIKDVELVHVADAEPKLAVAPFAILAKDAKVERMFATLAEAVAAAQAGDTIEIRGNGAFVGDTIHITKALTIRAASGYEPIVQLSADVTEKEGALFYAKAPLVLEGLHLHIRGAPPWKDEITRNLNVVHSEGAPLRIANCRFVLSRRDGIPRGLGAVNVLRCPSCEIRNRQSVIGGFVAVSEVPDESRFVVENCLSTSVHSLGVNFADVPIKKFAWTVRNNTLLGFSGLEVQLHASPAVVGPKEAKPFQIEATGNIFHGPLLLNQVEISPKKNPPLTAAEGEKVLRMLVNWTEKRNLYSVPNGFDFWSLAQNYKSIPLSRRCQTLADWQELWSLPKLDSLKGQPQFQHANWWARIESNAEQVLPADFRLKLGSPGKGAGEGGKDLGADMEFVGPGEAYETFKKMPAYQEWRKQTDALINAASRTP